MPIQVLQREARNAGNTARNNLTVGSVVKIHNADDGVSVLAGATPGRPLYTVRVTGRRGQEYDVFPVASAIPVQVGHWVFVSFLGADLHRGAWITGLTHPPTPQMVSDEYDINTVFGNLVHSDVLLPFTPTAGNLILSLTDAFVVTQQQTTLTFDLLLPAVRGKHDVTLSGLALFNTLTNPARPRHLIISPGSDATLSGGLGAPAFGWLAEVRLTGEDDTGAEVVFGRASHFWQTAGIITAGLVSDSVSDLERTWRFTDQLQSPQAVWTGAFDTKSAIGQSVDLQLYLVGRFNNPNEYTLPNEWAFTNDSIQFAATEIGFGSGLPAPVS